MTIPFSEMKAAPFKSYEDIPLLTKEYLVYVTNENAIEKIPLDDINGFMLMLYEAEVNKRAEWEDGWVL